MTKSKIDEIFAPRSSDYQSRMFIHRKHAETELKENISSDFHGILIGESGIGKTWLIGRVMDELQAERLIVNCNELEPNGDLLSMILNSGSDHKTLTLSAQEDEIQGGVLGTHAKTTKHYSVLQPEALRKALMSFLARKKNQPHVVVLENAEELIDSEQGIKSLERLFVFTDGLKLNHQKLKILVVVATLDAGSIIRKLKLKAPVRNRFKELKPLYGFDDEETFAFLQRGFIELLQWSHLGRDRILEWSLHIRDQTLGIPQQLHEYANHLAKEIEPTNALPYQGLINKVDEKYSELRNLATQDLLEEVQMYAHNAPFRLCVLNTMCKLGSIGRISISQLRDELNKNRLSPVSASQVRNALACFSEIVPPLFLVSSCENWWSWTDCKVRLAIRLCITKKNGELAISRKI